MYFHDISVISNPFIGSKLVSHTVRQIGKGFGRLHSFIDMVSGRDVGWGS